MLQKPSWRLIEKLRYASHSGRVISRHRALRTLDFRPASILHPIILLSLCYLGLSFGLESVLSIWRQIFAFALPLVNPEATISLQKIFVFGLIQAEIPIPEIVSALPNEQRIIGTIFITIACMAFAFLFLRRRALPLGYFIWAVGLLQLLSCLFFFLAPSRFGHTPASHITDGLSYVLNLVFIAPIILAFTYFVFDFQLWRKSLGTAFILSALILVAPMQYLLHIAALEQGSLLIMPGLYIFFGLLFDIAVFIAVYSWCVSWGK
ncbi:MAG: hypothetical protein AAF387_20740 [Pseudomonadota bacterium]